MAYGQLTKIAAKFGMEAHHIVQARFAGALGTNSRSMASVALTRAEHQMFDNLWRQALPYGREYSVAQIRTAARSIYRDYPELQRIAMREFK